MNWPDIFRHSFEIESQQDGCPPTTPCEYLAESIFNFTTDDSAMSDLFGRKAVEVCRAITDRTTFEYIKDTENYQWYLMILNTPFFKKRIEYGTSIRGAWWDYKIEIHSCGIWTNTEQLLDFVLTEDEVTEFMTALIEFGESAPPKSAPTS